jgi:hypothetical protein
MVASRLHAGASVAEGRYALLLAPVELNMIPMTKKPDCRYSSFELK